MKSVTFPVLDLFFPCATTVSLPQLEGDSAFFSDTLATQRNVFADMSLFVRFNQRLENNR